MVCFGPLQTSGGVTVSNFDFAYLSIHPILGHISDFGHFPIEIPIEVKKNYGQRKEWSYNKNKKCSEICEQNGTT